MSWMAVRLFSSPFLLAMFVGNIVPMIMVAGAANMDAYHSTLLVSALS